ncbi:hypothetical protein D9756_002258 [Leucocoprinus leucothites]|uniref:Nephrocystin 3-like N-terminal domain-containing protein n=1 Tax=Leucocoprinus leucothites TaxID=201217 RepID=A0A8H5GB82_9AGAR|nr:hypothetical protein D9756_002258 [Leucoagaricus leucothites]
MYRSWTRLYVSQPSASTPQLHPCLTTMAILPDAQNVLIQKSQFGTDQTIQIQNNISAGSSGIDVLLQASFPEATHDSNIRHPPPRCFPETRTQYIEDITQWVASPVERDPLPMYWMKGPAGVGKTAVAQTCAEKFKELNLLGAAFFFSVNGRADHTHFFPSVAYQLCTELSDFRQLLDNKISRDKTIVGKAMVWQFKNLFSESIQELQRMGKSVPRKAIIIDGLDECLSKEAQCEIIEIIAGSARESSTPFYWAFFSRPEMHIETTFAKNDIAPHCQLTILPISRTADKDIELYLRSGFANILLRRNLSVSSPWPSERDMKALIEACAGLFIYAATLLRYVDRPVAQGPIEQLNAVLASLGGASGTDGSPFAELDAFYTLILRRIPTEIFPSVRVLLGGMFLYSFHPTLFWSAVQLSNQLRLSEIQFKILCSELRAVLCFYDHDGPYDYGQSITTMSSLRHASFTDFAQIQQKARMLGGVITLHHKSFWDFLHDPARSGIYCISTQEMYNLLFSHYLQVWGDCQRCFSLQARASIYNHQATRF